MCLSPWMITESRKVHVFPSKLKPTTSVSNRGSPKYKFFQQNFGSENLYSNLYIRRYIWFIHRFYNFSIHLILYFSLHNQVGNQESQLIPEYKLENTDLPPFTLLHFGRLRLIWDWTILLIVAYLSVMLPFNVAFKAHQNLRIFYIADFCLEIVFIVDILLNFRTTFINPKTGRLVTKPKLIAHNYLTHWFPLDLLAALPFDILYLCNKDWVSAIPLLILYHKREPKQGFGPSLSFPQLKTSYSIDLLSVPRADLKMNISAFWDIHCLYKVFHRTS